MTNLNILTALKEHLLGVVKPGRYVGGEQGAIAKEANEKTFNVAVAFPDLYEIGMSNQALHLLYNYLNKAEGVAAQRVFAVAEDFERVLKEQNLSLYSLEGYNPLYQFDVVAFTIGYELAFTNVMAMLELGKIPLRVSERGGNDPIVIAGGPAVSNPAPWASFFDAIYIGEAEAIGLPFVEELAKMKEKGANRAEILAKITSLPAFWTPQKPAVRASWAEFGTKLTPLPVMPNIEVAQAHGVVEIMRGCPNSCRFCLAGTYYKPFRCKEIKLILKEVENLVSQRGFNEISLNSLSSADFPQIKELLQALNRRYKKNHISFGLPSLRVNSFGLDLLNELNTTRKSGLTFAVETPLATAQASLNKPVETQRIIDIMREAERAGWKKAKFYFMVGLPLNKQYEGTNEAEAIADYLEGLQKRTRFSFNVNVGIFIPKAHTPYEREAQLSLEQSTFCYNLLRERLGKNRSIKLNVHSPFFATIEGLLARGDEQSGEVALQAYQKGARFDSWDELAKTQVWQEVLKEAPIEVLNNIYRQRTETEQLPWHTVNFRLNSNFLAKENQKSQNCEVSEACKNYPCSSDFCGACDKNVHVVKNPPFEDNVLEDEPASEATNGFYRLLFSFSKMGRARYLSHLNLVAIFERTFQTMALPMRYSEGFNPSPCLSFASPLSLGIESQEEIAAIELLGSVPLDTHQFIIQINSLLPQGLCVIRAEAKAGLPLGRKYKSLMASYGSSTYKVVIEGVEEVITVKLGELSLIKQLEAKLGYNPLITASKVDIERLNTFASQDGEQISFFSI